MSKALWASVNDGYTSVEDDQGSLTWNFIAEIDRINEYMVVLAMCHSILMSTLQALDY